MRDNCYGGSERRLSAPKESAEMARHDDTVGYLMFNICRFLHVQEIRARSSTVPSAIVLDCCCSSTWMI